MQNLLLGAHCSISGGLYTAFDRAEEINATAIQIFTQNSRQWKSRQLNREHIEIYKRKARKSKVKIIISHDSYLINLGSPSQIILKKSRIAFKEEILRCHELGIKYLVFHPGAHLGTGEEEGIKTIAESLNIVHQETLGCKVITALETTAGQGTSIGYRFEHLRSIIGLVEDKKRIGVCVDTCHIFAAGYELRNLQDYRKTFKEFNGIIGIKYLKVFHLNDSKTDFSSRVDRHEHIGKGKIGKEAFRFILNDKRFRNIPKIIETPKSEDLHEDKINLRVLRRLCTKV